MIAHSRVIPVESWPAAEGSFRRELELLMNQYKTVRSVYTPEDFLEWREGKTLMLTPKFQRRDVWQPPAKSYFIDTLLRQMPVPPLYFRKVYNKEVKKEVREVIDGQQRIRAVLDFIDGRYRLSRTLNAPWKGMQFEQLSPTDQGRIKNFDFSSEIFGSISDPEVLDVFARLNTYSVPLNAQELRNGQYFGHFKQLSYELAHSCLEFWRRQQIFTEQNVARMLEVELTSELLIAGIAGMQDKKKSIDSFYRDNDDEYTHKERDKQRFIDIFTEISEAFGENGLSETYFRRPTFFYTLYCIVYHRRFGLPGQKKRKSTKKRLTASEHVSLREAVVKLSNVLQEAKDDEESVPRKYLSLVAASIGQTDNIKPRQSRFDYLYDEAFA